MALCGRNNIANVWGYIYISSCDIDIMFIQQIQKHVQHRRRVDVDTESEVRVDKAMKIFLVNANN